MKTPKTLFLHIGTGKAGSTSIQRSLGMIKDMSIGLHPVRAFGLPNATRLTMASGSPRARGYFVERRGSISGAEFDKVGATIWDTTQRAVEAANVDHFVSSSEFLCSLVRGPYIDTLRQGLETIFDRVEIIVYLRDQRSFIRSFWAQTVKGPSRSVKTFDLFLKNIEKSRYYWDYSEFLNNWSCCFGRDSIRITVLDSNKFGQQDLISDFFQKMGFPDLPEGLYSGVPENVTPEWARIEEIRLENLSRRPELAGNLSPPATDRISDYDSFILSKVSDGNRWVNETFLKDSSVKLPVV